MRLLKGLDGGKLRLFCLLNSLVFFLDKMSCQLMKGLKRTPFKDTSQGTFGLSLKSFPTLASGA